MLKLKEYSLAGLIILLIFALYLAFSKGQKLEKEKCTAQTNEKALVQTQKQIQTQNEVIKEIKTVIKRKAINRTTSLDDDILWLRKNRCSDCSSE